MKTNWRALRYGCLILAGVMLGGEPAIIRAQDAAGTNTAPAVISSVAITQAPQRAAIRVEGAGRLDVHAVRMQNPERLVLDFAGARLAVQKTSIPGVSAPVRAVRLGQFRPDVARVVIDLTSSAPYQIAHEGGAVVEYLEERPAQEPAPRAVTSTTNQSTKVIAYSPKAPRVSHCGKTSSAVAPLFPMPNALTQPSSVLAAESEKAEPTRPEGSTQQAAQQAVQMASNAAATVGSQQQPAASTATPAPSSRYTGEPISVNLKDVDLKDFFRLIHEISGLNVVLDPNVKGTLTIVLDEVPWDQALDIVLQNNGLDKQLNGNVLRVATREPLK